MEDDNVKTDQEPDAAPALSERKDDVITVVLTADNHLGYTGFGQDPRKREERQQRLRDAFQQATDFAIMQGVDIFVQAGDLFDTMTPDERDRSFVASRLAQLKQAGVRTFALGGVHDTSHGGNLPTPQLSYARLGALHYFPPVSLQDISELEPVLFDLHGIRVGICGLSVVAGQEGDPLADLRVQSEIGSAKISLLLLHAPIEGFSGASSLFEERTQVSQSSIAQQDTFKYILAGYHHNFSRSHLGQCELIVAGATQHVDFSTPDAAPGFVFLGLAADGVRWCNHIRVDALALHRLVLHTSDLWSEQSASSPTEAILERLRPLSTPETMIQLCLEGELTRSAYHQLDLNRIRRYGEEHCFALAIDDSALFLLPEEALSSETGERFSPREELSILADEWISAATDEREQKALRATKEAVLQAIDEQKEPLLLNGM